MLIVVSDLHFSDGTAGIHYLSEEVVRRELTALASRARYACARDVKLVLLGDIYDMLRTEAWFEIPPESRPWGASPSEEAANHVFGLIMAQNRPVFDLLSGSLASSCGFPVEPERVYVPGNHDRLCNLYPSLRERVRRALGQSPSQEPFEHVFVDVDHGALARHGQEWDGFNFEASGTFEHDRSLALPTEDYMQVPIGDVIACEFASRVPGLVRQRLGESPAAAVLYRQFQDLFDVRPLIAVSEWALFQAQRHNEAVQRAINDALRQVAEEFRAIPFVEEWLEAHKRRSGPFDETNVVRLVTDLLEHSGLTALLSRLHVLDRGDPLSAGKDKSARKAVEDFDRLDRDADLAGRILYVLYGHTHDPDQRAVGAVGDPPHQRERFYLNTGTWRPVHRQSLASPAFQSWTSVTYVLVYRPGERLWSGQVAKTPAVESWTGSVKEG